MNPRGSVPNTHFNSFIVTCSPRALQTEFISCNGHSPTPKHRHIHAKEGRRKMENVAAKALPPEDEKVFRDMGYSFSKQIGSGSYAKVFLVERKYGKETKHYACKIINTKDAPAEFTRKFLPRELDILSKVKHPNIIYIQGMFHRNGKILIFMQNAEEGDLLEYILKEQDIPEILAKLWSHQMIVALHYLHAYRIAHRDIKCENVLITRHMNAKLADFGFAKFVPTPKVLSKTYCGSIAYAAPEVMKGKPYAPVNADVWSLGVVFYVILNRALPFPLEKYTPKQILKMQLSRAWKFRAKALGKYAPQSLTLVQQMLEPDPRKRPTSQTLLSAEWFSIADKDKSVSMELTEFEKLALEAAESARIDNVEASLNTTRFDLLDIKTEPYPSVNILKPPPPPQRPSLPPTLKRGQKEPSPQETSIEPTPNEPVDEQADINLNRISEQINLKDGPTNASTIIAAQATTADPAPN